MKYLIAIFVAAMLVSCGEDPVPKPLAYYRIATPAKVYRPVDSLSCFSFDAPDYAFIKASPDMPTGERCWYNMYFPRFNAELYLTYKQIGPNAPLEVLMEDLYKTAYGHSNMAENITTKVFSDPKTNKYGIIYNVSGNVASNVQFAITDSSRNFIRGSLYFACTPNKDSLAPVLSFIHKDVDRLIDSFKWK